MYDDNSMRLKPMFAFFGRGLIALALAAAAFATPLASPILPAAAAAQTYYLDCSAGQDSRTGLSPSLAWKSLNKANQAPLGPGDSLLLKRGCTWTGTLKAKWNGTAAAPIVIGAYGSGELPKIQNSAADLTGATYTSVDITGSYLIIEYLQTAVVNPPVKADCQNNPIGFFVGFNFRNPNNTANGGSHNILRYSKAAWAMAGVHFNNNTHDDKVLYNTLVDNNVMMKLTPKSVHPTDDIGAWGILLKGRNHEVAYNFLSRNNAICTYDTLPQGNSIEVYEARNSNIHHNTSVNDRVFSELGGSANLRADGITFAYNLVISNIHDARFIVVRGGGNQFGPTYRTTVVNNTVYFTGAASQGIVCGAGCSGNILSAYNNIIWAEEKAAFADAAFTEHHNVYWNSAGAPFVQFQGFALSSSSKLANPLFMNPGNRNFNLKAASPAINIGALTGWTVDLNNLFVPQASLPDVGAFEYSASSAGADDVGDVEGEPPVIFEVTDTIYLPVVTGGQ